MDKRIKFDPEFGEFLSAYTWRINDGYVKTSVRVGDKIKTTTLHRFLLLHPKSGIDHKNGNPLDNRLKNLRIATEQENAFNQKISVRNTSGYKGVHWDNTQNKWRAMIRINGIKIALGSFSNKQDAIRARRVAAKKVHGEFYRPR